VGDAAAAEQGYVKMQANLIGWVRDTKVEDSSGRIRAPLVLSAFICVHLVRQEKPGRSRGMKGAHHVNYPFDM
jgi:hypothetical protein